MDFEKTFPLRYYINLGRREDRRTELEFHLDQIGVTAQRFPAIDSRFCRNPRGYENKGRYALALTIRLAIREAKQQKAPALLLPEDDAILHPNFRELISRLDLPDDWGIFYLGCQHTSRPLPHSDGLVKVTRALDSHAWAIHQSAYDEVMAAMAAFNKPTPIHALASDQFVAALHQKIPTYACYPNLAWQSVDESDLTGTTYSLYGKVGAQKIHPHIHKDLLTECLAPQILDQPPKLGLLFLTRGDVHHPEIWQEWLAQSPDDVKIFTHAKSPEDLIGGFLEGTQIADQHETAWGEISLVNASLALLKAAMEDETLTHFALVSESCLPVQSLKRFLLRLTHDKRTRFGFRDWKKASEASRHRSLSAPEIPQACWRFHQQWWLLDRAAAVLATRHDHTDKFANMFAPDEGYFGTVLMMEGYPVDDIVHDKDLTWTHWGKDAGSPESHPVISSEHLSEILNSDAFFARKFPKEADIGKYGLHLESLPACLQSEKAEPLEPMSPLPGFRGIAPG